MPRKPKPGDGRAVIFDLDGTLVDSAPDIAAALNRLLETDGLAPLPLPVVMQIIGDGTAVLIQRAYARHNQDLLESRLPERVDRLLAFYLDHPADQTLPYPGVFDTLIDLIAAGFTLSVCTNKAQHLAEVVLDETGLAPFFVATIGGDTEHGRKPQPHSLQAAIAATGCALEDVMMIGDSANDVNAAKAVGIPVVAVTYGYCNTGPVESLGADHLIDRFDALPALLGLSPAGQ